VLSDFAFDVVDDAGVRVMSLHGQLDLVNAERVRDAIVQMDGSLVVVDLQGLQFLDSSGIAALLQARRRVTESGRGFQMRGAHGIVLRALEVTGLAHLVSD
jgi:anti-sigma B factor antagonist